MANTRLNRLHPACLGVLRTTGAVLLCSVFLVPPAALRATGGYDDQPPPTLPYYLDRLPAKPPALIFEETFGGPTASARPTDFKASLLEMAAACEKGQPSAALLASTDDLLIQARHDPSNPAPMCNLLQDVRDLFAANPPVTGKTAAGYIRWRVEHAGWFQVYWDDRKPPETGSREDVQRRGKEAEATLAKLASDSAAGPLQVHWLYLQGARAGTGDGEKHFQQVVDRYPDHPRAEAARFMLARCKLRASRTYTSDPYTPPTPEQAEGARRIRVEAQHLFEDYLERYPHGRFSADVPGWLGALAFDDQDYLRALDQYIQQADVPGHPEVLKSAGFMCERCLSRLASANDEAALGKVALHPRLAMGLIYLLVNSPESNNYDGALDSPAQVRRWRTALLPRLAAAVAAHKDAYTGDEWKPRYLAILAQAASGTGDQAKALALCDLDQAQLASSDDLAFIRLVALARARRLPEAIAAGDDFARRFPKSPLASGAALRRILALVDDHQSGPALGALYRLRTALAAPTSELYHGENGPPVLRDSEMVYPGSDAELSTSDSVLSSDTSGAETTGLAEITDALLNFAPLPELAFALTNPSDPLDEANAMKLRSVLVQRWLAEEENFAEAKKYATPAQWSLAAATLEKLAAEATSALPGEARAKAYSRLAEGWSAARGKLLFAPLETDKTRSDLFSEYTGAERAGLLRRENGLALGFAADRVNHALSSRDEWRHAYDWWLKSADAAAEGTPARASVLWAALRIIPSMTLVSPYTFLQAGETNASRQSRELYDRLRRECPASREAREFAVYYDLAPPPLKSDQEARGQEDKPADSDKKAAEPDLSAAASQGRELPYGEPEYRWRQRDDDDVSYEDAQADPDRYKMLPSLAAEASELGRSGDPLTPGKMAAEVSALRAKLNTFTRQRNDLFLVNFLDDLSDFLQEPSAKLTPQAMRHYVRLRQECLRVGDWGGWRFATGFPVVSEAEGEGKLGEATLADIRAAYQSVELASFKDYLDFLALAVVANTKIEVAIPGEMQDAKEVDEPGKKEPVTYASRDYPKLAKLTEDFLRDHPRSRKREAARLLQARALYAASRPRVLEKFAVWPRSGHFQSGRIIITHRQAPFEPRRIGAALNAYDREFPQGRYAADIRDLRALLAWRTQDWGLALDLTLQALADKHEPVLQQEADKRLKNLFADGLLDETERQRCLAAIKARPAAVKHLRDHLPVSPYPLRMLQSWVLAQR